MPAQTPAESPLERLGSWLSINSGVEPERLTHEIVSELIDALGGTTIGVEIGEAVPHPAELLRDRPTATDAEIRAATAAANFDRATGEGRR